MSFKISKLSCRKISVGEQRAATIVLSDGTQVEVDIWNDFDWNWFSNNGFLDTETIINPVTGEKAWNWLMPIESVTLDSETIGDFAFDDCTSLETVNLSENVKTIGESTFYKCVNLQAVNGLDSVTSIGWWAFDRCTNLQLDHLPPNLTFLGYGAFANCENFTGDIVIPSGVTEIDKLTFYNCGLTGVTIHAGVNAIGENAFQECNFLTYLTFQGKTMDEVRGLENYPWGVDESIIQVA